MRLHIWMNFPSHHQSGFFLALIAAGAELQVTYYSEISPERAALGWTVGSELQPWERSVEGRIDQALMRLRELSDYIHIIPGYGSPLLRELAAVASAENIRWCHWSEASHPGPRWLVGLPRKMHYARLVNAHALGAFAQGDMARRDFMRWGIRAEKIAHLFYAVSPIREVSPDPGISRFSRGRLTFVFLGQLNRRKAIDVQIEAFSQVDSNNACLVLVGSGNSSAYEHRIAKSNLADRVRIFPAVPSHAIAAVQCAADVLLLPSRFDGWGVALNEAASLGKALIASTATGAGWHLIEPGINGFIADAGSTPSLANAMSHYTRGGNDLARSHGLESRRIAKRFSCEAAAERLLGTLRSWS